nr:uncharacterized protein LOC129382580 [Dermacentor andersoni]
MGAGNQAVWRLRGMVATRYGRPKTTCARSCGNGRSLHFLADAPHLLKNLRGHLVREQKICLDAETVQKHRFPRNEVRLDYIKRLCETDEKHDLKLAPHLKPKYLSPNHYEKMNVGTACAIFDHGVASAIKLLVDKDKLPKETLTTTWFLQFVHQSFALMSSRTSKMALSDLCPEKGTGAVHFLQGVIEVFTKLQIYDAGKSSSVWKPVHSGVIITTRTALRLRELMIKERGLKYILLSRFAQDALQNLFSTIRLKSPVPRAREFKYALRMIVLAQFFQPSKKGSYQIDDGGQLAQFVSTKTNVLKPLEEEVVERNDVSLAAKEQECLHYLASYIARNVLRKNKLCGVCSAALKGSSEDSGRLLKMKNYVEGKESLCIPSQPVTGLLQEAEEYFRGNEKQLTEGKMTVEDLQQVVKKLECNTQLPSCHKVMEKVLGEFLCRLRFSLRKRNNEMLKLLKEKPKCGSKSMVLNCVKTFCRFSFFNFVVRFLMVCKTAFLLHGIEL